MSYAVFYALMSPDNSATITPGSNVSFPPNGPIADTNVSRLDPSSFNLGPIETYQILFQVSTTEAGQLLLTLNGRISVIPFQVVPPALCQLWEWR